MKVDLKKAVVIIGAVGAVLTATGLGWAGFTGKLKGAWTAGERLEILEEKVAKLEEENKHLEHFKESIFNFAIAITDNDDVEPWKIGTHGTEYPADVRNTAEDYEMAFIKYMWMIYELRYDTDSLRYIMLHDKNEHGSNRVDLYKSD
jgi:hypothetical protein